MAKEEWILDGFIQYLMSPIWKYHVENFIDNNCLIFDTEEENKFVYTDVYRDYQITIEKVLQDFMKDINMTIPQLISSCSEELVNSTQYEKLFQPLLAVDDFLLFKSMMVKRNIQLNQEAENELHKQHDVKRNEKSVSEDEELLAKVLLQSKLEHERKIQEEEEEFQRLLRQATEESLKSYEEEIKQSTYEDDRHLLSDNIPTVSTSVRAQSTSTVKTQIQHDTSTLSSEESAANWIESAKKEAVDNNDHLTHISQSCDDLQKREEYLREQRRKIVEKKMKKREMEMEDYLKSNPMLPEVVPANNDKKRKKSSVLTPAVANKLES